MPIKSYLAYPVNGKRDELAQALRSMPECEIIPSTNQDIIILVTDTIDTKMEEALEKKLRDLSSLQCLTLVSGYKDPITD